VAAAFTPSPAQKAKVSENLALLEGSSHDGKATCSFQSASAYSVPSSLVKALKKKQQGGGGEKSTSIISSGNCATFHHY